nr:MAG TPA: hypothetical protein [Caudoviricetes sp.]
MVFIKEYVIILRICIVMIGLSLFSLIILMALLLKILMKQKQ